MLKLAPLEEIAMKSGVQVCCGYLTEIKPYRTKLSILEKKKQKTVRYTVIWHWNSWQQT